MKRLSHSFAMTAIATVLPFTFAAPAFASSGDLDVKLMVSLVAPDGEISSVHQDQIGLPSDGQSKAEDNVTPTIALQYFVSNRVSIETIAGLTEHDVGGRGGLNGAELVSDAKILPTTLTVKYHFGKDGGIRPYVGAGPSYFFFIDEKSGNGTKSLGADQVKIGDKLGAAVQAGVDIPLGQKGLFASLDAKRYWMRPTASWTASGTEVLKTRQKLDPWLISAGVGFRF